MLVRLQTLWWAIRDRDEGATMPEYALIVALIAVFAIGATTNVGSAVSSKFGEIATGILNAGGGG